MANYIAEIPIDTAAHRAEFLQGLTSLATSSVLADLDTIGGVTFAMLHASDQIINAVFKYQSVEHDKRWHTSALISRSDTHASMRVEVLPLEQTGDLFRPGKPAIVNVLLDALGTSGVPPFKITDTAFTVTSKNVTHCERLVQGTSDSSLPVFYSTKDFLANKQLDPVDMSRQLFGLAHVFIEGDKHVRKNLQKRLKTIENTVSLWPACLLWPGEEGMGRSNIIADRRRYWE